MKKHITAVAAVAGSLLLAPLVMNYANAGGHGGMGHMGGGMGHMGGGMGHMGGRHGPHGRRHGPHGRGTFRRRAHGRRPLQRRPNRWRSHRRCWRMGR